MGLYKPFGERSLRWPRGPTAAFFQSEGVGTRMRSWTIAALLALASLTLPAAAAIPGLMQIVEHVAGGIEKYPMVATVCGGEITIGTTSCAERCAEYNTVSLANQIVDDLEVGIHDPASTEATCEPVA